MGSGRTRARGITAPELMVVVAITAILAALAAPSFGALRQAAGVGTATAELLGALHFARSSAVLTGAPVTLCLSADAVTCARAGSADVIGWLVFEQPDATAFSSFIGEQRVLRTFRLPPDVSLHAPRSAVTFWPVTRAATTSTFDVCDIKGKARGRAVVVSQTGRPRVQSEGATCTVM